VAKPTVSTVSKSKDKAPRRRLDAQAARDLILEATAKRLVVAGPGGIRLQEVAADAGVSHPTVLHHFGSREQLVKAVVLRSIRSISADLVEAIGRSTGEDADLEAMVESVATVFEQTGHARVVTWLALEGQSFEEGDALRNVVDATHAMRLKRCKKGSHPTREDTARTVVLAALSLIAGTVLGPPLMQNAGLGAWPKSGVAFRRWLTRLLVGHLDGDGKG
jgi:AcrR family transcriptional regulator